MGRHAIRSREIIVDGGAGWALSTMPTNPPIVRLNLRVCGVDDVDARVRTIGEIVFGAIRIDPADVERPKRIARDLNGREAFCLRVVGAPGPVHGAATALVVASDIAANRAGPTEL